MMTTRTTRKALIAGGIMAMGLVVAEAPAESPTLNPCAAVTPRTLDSYARSIEEALKWASADAAKNGRSGQHAAAATNSRDLLQHSLDQIKTASSALSQSSPSVTSPAEAHMMKEYVRNTLERIPAAAHWSTVSEIYHKSTDARKAFDGSVVALEQGTRLFAEAGRCYMDGL
jgi:hypothetical protein